MILSSLLLPLETGYNTTSMSYTYNAWSLDGVLPVAVFAAVIIGALLVVSHTIAMYRLGRGLRMFLVSLRYFLYGGVSILVGYSGYMGLDLLTKMAAGGDPVVMLEYAGLAVGGYAGIASFGYIMSHLFKEYRGNFDHLKSGFFQKIEVEKTPVNTVKETA